MNKYPIDLVVPWVNSEDEIWQKDFLFWSKKETGNTDRCRIRDLGQLKYLLRSIDMYCPWIRYVFLIVYGKTQIPTWLNTDNAKLKIIYHSEFIPNEFLPTFNSFTMDMNLHRIPELSEHFIFCNDDMLFLSQMKETDFFNNDRPQFPFKWLRPGKFLYNTCKFDKTLKNVFNFIKKITGKDYTANLYHMPIPLNKSFQAFMWKKYGDEFHSSLISSKFRQPKNYFNWLFFYMQQITGNADDHDSGRNYLGLNNYIKKYTLDRFLGQKGPACINDCEALSKTAEKTVSKILIESLNKKYPKKSSFEK